MTDLQKLYTKIRLTKGLKHRAAIKAMTEEVDLDEETIIRCLARAKRDDNRPFRKAKK